VKNEIWKKVPGFEKYEVSNLGRVRCWKKGKPRLLKLVIDHVRNRQTGKIHYKRYKVSLSKGSVRKDFICSGLVLLSFVGIRPQGAHCRHLDGNSLNNNLNNLAYGSPLENYEDARENGTFTSILTEGDVQDIRFRLSKGERNKDIAKDFDITSSAISDIKCKKSWSWLKNIHNEKIVLYRGSRIGTSKLKEEDILKIRPRINNGESLADIAKDFGVVAETIWSIKQNKSWSWLKEPTDPLVKELAAAV
jgi:uncharacterized protein (DUF433 family)